MGHPVTTRAIGRTVVVGLYLVALAFAGRPIWLAVLLGVALALVWAAPLLLAPPQSRPSAASGSASPSVPGAESQEFRHG
jgi:hypothetical protein